MSWADRCSQVHDAVDDDGIGQMAVDSDVAGVQGWRSCDECRDAEQDHIEWLRRPLLGRDDDGLFISIGPGSERVA